MDGYYRGKAATLILKVHTRTLYNWERAGKIEVIRTAGGHRLYNVKKYLEKTKTKSKEPGHKICYARVSSKTQKDDLERQIGILHKKYPKYEVITDIGSGLNFNREGLQKIVEIAISGKLEDLVIVHKDRLARFGYDLVKFLVMKYSGISITVISAEIKKEPREEMVEDILSIMNIFTAKINGMRKHKYQN